MTALSPITKKVSVIIPTFNRRYTIPEAINSVLNQTYQNFEIVVIDDGSSDDTWKIIKKYNTNKIKYIYQKHSGLPAKARNTGIKLASGEYIAFLDSDDIWMPTKLELQVKFLEKHQDYSLVSSNMLTFGDIKENRKIYNPKFSTSGFVFRKLVLGNFVANSTAMVRKSAIEDVGYFNEDKRLFSVEDFEFYLRIARKYKIHYSDGILAQYRIHSTNIFNINKKYKSILYVYKKINQINGSKNIPDWLMVIIKIKLHLLVIKEYFMHYINILFKNN